MRNKLPHILGLLAMLLLCGCDNSKQEEPQITVTVAADTVVPRKFDSIRILSEVKVARYFEFMDSVVSAHDSLTSYGLTEHLLVRANPWIIDTLANTDYYRKKAKDSFVYNQRQMIVLPKNSVLIVPDSIMAAEIFEDFKQTSLDLNIPEFKLRIYQDSTLQFEFPVRVGRYEKKYLQMSGRTEDLRTKTGMGNIIGYNKNPRYVNPCNNKEYFATRRDDDSLTKLPRIPFIETEINGLRHGQMIHPTTNPETLGKAYSNGCIGTAEADAWVIYYHAPIGTAIHIRYELEVSSKMGDSLVLPDIYGRK